MFEGQNAVLFDIFSGDDTIDSERLGELEKRSQDSGASLADLIVESGMVGWDELFRVVADYLDLECVLDPPATIEENLASEIPPFTARNYGVVPVRAEGNSLVVLVRDPFDSQVIDDLTFSLEREVVAGVCDPDAVEALIDKTYGKEGSSVGDFLREIERDSLLELEEEASEDEIYSLANDTPIIRFLNLILSQAVAEKASDIHFEPFEDHFHIRYRIDGALYEMTPAPRYLSLPVISRIKVLSNLNIAERRIPQDGRIRLTISGRPIDLRVSTLPTQHGESVVLRVLDRSIVDLDLEKLSMPADVLLHTKKIASRPNGVFIVTGPTGSGKTTTLYSALREVNRPGIKILTAEDPVEYDIEGIMQVSVHHQIGLTFSTALRSFLRQDPDKIMVGEIRDLETARIAVQASLTEHLVMSTLHTNDAPGAITRLIDMGLEPYLIASTLECVLAQRLIRRNCRDCRTNYQPRRELLKQLDGFHSGAPTVRFFYGRGCEACSQIGYRGRMGLYELLKISDPFRELISSRAPTLQLRKKAIAEGMRTLREEGMRAIVDGESTVEEVLRCT